jgi:hypothetical protein
LSFDLVLFVTLLVLWPYFVFLTFSFCLLKLYMLLPLDVVVALWLCRCPFTLFLFFRRRNSREIVVVLLPDCAVGVLLTWIWWCYIPWSLLGVFDPGMYFVSCNFASSWAVCVLCLCRRWLCRSWLCL